MSTQTRSLLTRVHAAFTAPPTENSTSANGFGFTCCGLTGGPWPSRGEAESLAAVHDHLHHLQPGQPAGARVAQVVPASALPNPAVTDTSSGVQITAQSGLSVGGGQS